MFPIIFSFTPFVNNVRIKIRPRRPTRGENNQFKTKKPTNLCRCLPIFGADNRT